MQTILGFWCFQVPSVYITRTVTVIYCDDGFGNLIPASLPAYAINALDIFNG